MRRILYLIPLLILLLALAWMPVKAQTTAGGESEPMQGFARSVEILDGRVLIGEPSNFHQPGLVYEFSKSGDTWEQSALFRASDGEVGNNFGSVLSADGNLVLIGAPDANDDSGAAYLFEQDTSGEWTEISRLTLADTSETGFGSSVLLKDDLAFVGAPDHADGTGAVVVYRNSGGNLSEITTIANPDTAGSNFGSTLAMADANLVIGAPARDGGFVYVYEESDSVWNLTSKLRSQQVDERSLFGASLNIRGKPDLCGSSPPQFRIRCCDCIL